MSLLADLPRLIEESRAAFEEAGVPELTVHEKNGSSGSMLALCDSISFSKFLLSKGLAGKISTIYMDPPFLSGSDYSARLSGPGGKSISHHAYSDRWTNDEEGYIRMLCSALWGAKSLVSPQGSVFLHLDWHFVHYMKICMDEIFGRENFINEIIWQYKSGGSSKKHFARKHDTILMYGSSKDHYFDIPKEKSYNRGMKPYHFKGVDEYEDENGWYTLVNMKDVWAIDMVGRTSSERTGYATQKPEALLDRIIRCSSAEGDICADLFCGSGTLPVCAARSGRRFFACDTGRLAISITKKRLYDEGARFIYYAGDEYGGSGKIEAEVTCTEDGRDIKITGYTPDLTYIDLNEKDEALFRDMTPEDGLALIESVSIDPGYDGSVQEPAIYRVKTKGAIDLEASVGSEGKISIVVSDIFGLESQLIIS